MKEIGGYFELDTYTGKTYHPQAIALNCGRNCLAYLVETRNYKKVYIPKFLCLSVKEVCDKMGVSYDFYEIDNTLRPVFNKSIEKNEVIYIVNYYGQLSNDEINNYNKKWGNIIIDSTQDFFRKPLDNNIDTLYTCRKYFGVADGAYLYTNLILKRELEIDISYNHSQYLLGRFEKGASEFYKKAQDNNLRFQDEPIKHMSKLTNNLLRGIDYNAVQEKREENFQYLHNHLKAINRMDIKMSKGPFMYPLHIANGDEIRKKLQKQKIFVPTLWSDVFEICKKEDIEFQLAENILPLPIDQRYDIKDMKIIVDAVQCLGNLQVNL